MWGQEFWRIVEDLMDAIFEIKRDVLMSIRPQYASKILDGRKTVELRRKFPEVGAIGATVLIYSSSPVKAIVGTARIKKVAKLPTHLPISRPARWAKATSIR